MERKQLRCQTFDPWLAKVSQPTADFCLKEVMDSETEYLQNEIIGLFGPFEGSHSGPSTAVALLFSKCTK